MKYQSLNPTTGQVEKEFPLHSDAAVEAAIAKAHEAWREWRRTSFTRRADLMQKCAAILEERATALAEMMAREMGKPLGEGEAEAKKCAGTCRYYADNTEAFLRSVPHPSDASESYVRYDPIGIIFAIMPWNFPFWQVFRHGAPTLMAGNVIVLKHSPNTPQCAAAIEEILREAGAPEGLLTNLYITNDQAAEVIGDARVRGVTLTGSTRAGREIGATAGRALKKSVLELGGSDPFIILDDADIDEAVKIGVASRCLNSGQSCIAAKRFLVQHSIADTVRAKFADAMKARVVGDPLDRKTTIGPMARLDLRDGVADQVERARSAGSSIVIGGKKPAGLDAGFFYEPTVIDNVTPDSPAWSEEIFGPVATFITFKDDADAVRIANDSPFGLGASIWTRDIERAKRLAPVIESGCVFVNGLVKSDPRYPFGGIKDSGYGRELGRDGVIEFMNAKTIWIK